jgi:hypothetical protein
MARMARSEVFAPNEVAVVHVIKNPGDTKIISVCRVSTANDGGAGGDESISRGTESQVFRGRAAGKRMRTRSSRNKANENPCLVDFSTSEVVVNLPPSDFLESMLLSRWQ